MGKSYVSMLSHKDDPSQKPELWLDDSDACILSFMLGIELLTDTSAGEWAAAAGRKCLLTAVICATGAIDPQLDEQTHSPERLRSIDKALDGVRLKLGLYRGQFPGRYWAEHNMLSPGEPMPPDLPTVRLLRAIRTLKEEAAQLLRETMLKQEKS